MSCMPAQALDRAFNTFVPLLYVMWTQSRGTTDASATAALVLEALAFLHFARARHGLYADLVQVSAGLSHMSGAVLVSCDCGVKQGIDLETLSTGPELAIAQTECQHVRCRGRLQLLLRVQRPAVGWQRLCQITRPSLLCGVGPCSQHGWWTRHWRHVCSFFAACWRLVRSACHRYHFVVGFHCMCPLVSARW